MTTIEHYWDRAAPDYDTYPDHGLLHPDARAAWREVLRAWLPASSARVADLACGTGTMGALAAELGHDVVGIDISAAMVERARAKLAPYGGSARVLKGDVSDPDLPPRSVDVVLARHILWTLPDPHASLARWVRLVRPGGRMVLVEGLWCGPDDGGGTSHDEDVRMPWARGVPSAELRAALRDLVASTHVVPLWDPVLWGKDLVHERYLVVAEVGDHVPTWRTERWDPAGSRLLG